MCKAHSDTIQLLCLILRLLLGDKDAEYVTAGTVNS